MPIATVKKNLNLKKFCKMSENKIHNLRRCGSDPRVKKSLIRNTERRLTSPEPTRWRLSPEKKSSGISAGLRANSLVAAGPSLQPRGKMQYSAGKGDGSVNTRFGASIFEKLDKPKLCSSLALHKYIEQVKLSQPYTKLQNVEIDAKTLNEKVSKRLNFPLDEKIYKNLIPLNDSKTQTRLQKYLSSIQSTQRTLKLKLSQREIEAAIDNIFLEDFEERTVLQAVPCPTKPITSSIATTQLYKNVSSFEDLSSTSDISD